MSNYTFIWSNTHQLFYMRGNIDSYIRYKHIPFNDMKRALQVSHGSMMSFYQSTEDTTRFVKEGERLFDSSFVDAYIKEAKAQYARHFSFLSKFSSISFSNQTNEELLTLWRTLLDHYSHSVAYFRSTQEEPTRLLIARVSETISREEFDILMVSPELDDINKESIAWQAFIEKGFSREKAQVHLSAFPWLFQNVLSHEDTLKELEQRALHPAPRGIREEKEKLRKEQAVLLLKYPAIAKEVDILQKLALLRSEIKSAWASTGFYALPILVEIAKRFELDLRTFTFFYRHEDVESLLETGKLLTKKEIEERKLCTAYFLKDGALFDYVGTKANAVAQKELKDTSSQLVEVSELKGIPARPGKVKGIIHILHVNNPEAAQKFRASFKGGILVTSMTQPNIIDIAERADAIVTDEGGMLSHAAIISREFGIPCVVGTKVATRILKDGDMVEVDAEKGVVKILS